MSLAVTALLAGLHGVAYLEASSQHGPALGFQVVHEALPFVSATSEIQPLGGQQGQPAVTVKIRVNLVGF